MSDMSGKQDSYREASGAAWEIHHKLYCVNCGAMNGETPQQEGRRRKFEGDVSITTPYRVGLIGALCQYCVILSSVSCRYNSHTGETL